MDVMEFKGKTIDDAITAASVELGVTSDKLNIPRKPELPSSTTS